MKWYFTVNEFFFLSSLKMLKSYFFLKPLWIFCPSLLWPKRRNMQMICICLSSFRIISFSTLFTTSENDPLGASEMPLQRKSCTWLSASLWDGRVRGTFTSSPDPKGYKHWRQGKLCIRWCFLCVISEFKAAVRKKRKMGTPFPGR